MLNRIVRLLLSFIIAGTMALVPLTASAQAGSSLEVYTSASCEIVTFSLEVVDGAGDYEATFQFGDGENAFETFTGPTFELEHSYPAADTYEWMIEVQSLDSDMTEVTSGSVQVGPEVTLTSDPFPPVLTLENGSATAEFSAETSNYEGALTYLWDMDGNGEADDGGNESSSTASFEYSEAGKFNASVQVTDACDLSASDTLPVVVFDPEDACHPRAQDIAKAVSGLFPGQSEDTYSCEDIFGMFNGDLTDGQLGFGRMWHAYQLAASLEELTWQEILDWHLNQGGWGLLTQLDRFAEALTDVGLPELTQMVINGDASINEIRTAVRSVVRYEADFADALARLQEGASPGELGQFYRLASDLELEPEMLDQYLDEGLSLPEVKHLGSLSQRFGAELEELAAARQAGSSWGDLNQAYRLAGDGMSAAEILEMGVKEYREQQRQQDQEERELERQERTAQRLADQYGLTSEEVQLMYEGCGQEWTCVRQQLKEQAQNDRQADRDERTAERLASQYGVPLTQVWSVFNGQCSGDWSCVRGVLRDLNPPGQGKNH